MDYQKTESFYTEKKQRYNRPGPYQSQIRFDMMCKNPVTKEYYQFKEERDIEEVDEDTGEKKIVRKDVLVDSRIEIIRVKRVFNLQDHKEYLLSEGYRLAGNSYHEVKSCDVTEPEMYVETIFKLETKPHPTIEGQTVQVRTGNNVTINRYTMLFNQDNLAKLMSKARPDVELIVKEEGRGGPKFTIYDYNDFANKSFDELYYRPTGKLGESPVTQRDTRSMEGSMVDPAADQTKNPILNPEVRQGVKNLPNNNKSKSK